MVSLPTTDDAPVVRTDFSDQVAWEALCETIRAPFGDDSVTADVAFVDDPAFQDLTSEQILALATDEDAEVDVYLFVVDKVTFSSPEWPVLVIDLVDEPGSSFRVVASSLYMVENNLSLGNSDFCDFAEGVDEDGVFRGGDAPSPHAVFNAMRGAVQSLPAHTTGGAAAAVQGRPLGRVDSGGAADQ
jgi:hypothetical protein